MRWMILAVLLGAGCAHPVRPLRRLSAEPVRATAIAWSADASLVAWGADDGIIRVCNVQSGQEVARTDGYVSRGRFTEPTRLGFSPDNRLIAFGSTSGVVRVWDWRDGSIIELIGHTRPLLGAMFTPDGMRLVTASGGLEYLSASSPTTLPRGGQARDITPTLHRTLIIVFDIKTGAPLSNFEADGFMQVTFSRNAQLFAGTRLDVGPSPAWPLPLGPWGVGSPHLRVCETETGRIVHQLPVPGWNTQFSPDGKLLLSQHTVWDLSSGRAIIEERPEATVFLSSEQLLMVKPLSDTSLWPVALVPTRVKLSSLDIRSSTARYIGEFEPEGGLSGFGQALNFETCFSPDRKLLVDRQMNLWAMPQ
jgi:WD40 repeat protein